MKTLYFFVCYLMRTVLIALLLIIGIIFVGSVLLQSPKWGGIGMWIGWASAGWSNEYWSKKTMEWKLKIISLCCAILFVAIVVVYPYVK